ncbi:hypothetical protein HC891_19440, partial [Candidatus Gracilibacteria bacterium]|nr:hypothetical protein [Candidatus Gracilibacteria bacterium]
KPTIELVPSATDAPPSESPTSDIPTATASPDATPSELAATVLPTATSSPTATLPSDSDVISSTSVITDGTSVLFVPGQETTLESPNGRVEAVFASDTYTEPLELNYRTKTEHDASVTVAEERSPDTSAGFGRGFEVFHLHATDLQGEDVHQFSEPLTLTVEFTPQQLAVLGINPLRLTLFWWDDTKGADQSRWVPLPTVVDVETGTVTTRVDHFSAFQLNDGSSPSEAYLPSVKGWQVDTFTGAASFDYPLDVPAGPGGLKPQLNLTYNSSATDSNGWNNSHQAGWVGWGWTLETGSISFNRLHIEKGDEASYYALTINGRSYTVVRGSARPGGGDVGDPTHWNWYTADESHLKIRAVYTINSNVQSSFANPVGTNGPRGAKDSGAALKRLKWIIWDKSGTRYEFAEDLWWGWEQCTLGGYGSAYFEPYRWLLTKVKDPHDNVINYTYLRNAHYGTGCGTSLPNGVVDQEAWLETVTWGSATNPDIYRVTFTTTGRSLDNPGDAANPNEQTGAIVGPLHQTRQLTSIKVWSKRVNTTPTTWDQVREYRLEYHPNSSDSVYSDFRHQCSLGEQNCTPGLWGPVNSAKHKLTLKSIAQYGKTLNLRSGESTDPLPKLSFTYNTNGGTGRFAANGWNRLRTVDNGQGGTITFDYEHLALITDTSKVFNRHYFENRHRVTKKSVTDGIGDSFVWTYAYGPARLNDLGTDLDQNQGLSTGKYPTTATGYYNSFVEGSATAPNYKYSQALAQPLRSEFRGHAWTSEIYATDTSQPTVGEKTTHYFYQGDAGCKPAGYGPHTAITGDTCFKQLLKSELFKGRAYKREVYSSAGAELQETLHSYEHGPVEYSTRPVTGLWRAFSYESAVEEIMLDGGTIPSTRRMEYYFNPCFVPTCTRDHSQLDSYGNLLGVKEFDRGTLVRVTSHGYAKRDTTDSSVETGRYIVDRNSVTSILDGNGNYLAHSQRFYDEHVTSQGVLGNRGLLTREFKSSTVPFQTSVTEVTLFGQDKRYSYDAVGNKTAERPTIPLVGSSSQRTMIGRRVACPQLARVRQRPPMTRIAVCFLHKWSARLALLRRLNTITTWVPWSRGRTRTTSVPAQAMIALAASPRSKSPMTPLAIPVLSWSTKTGRARARRSVIQSSSAKRRAARHPASPRCSTMGWVGKSRQNARVQPHRLMAAVVSGSILLPTRPMMGLVVLSSKASHFTAMSFRTRTSTNMSRPQPALAMQQGPRTMRWAAKAKSLHRMAPTRCTAMALWMPPASYAITTSPTPTRHRTSSAQIRFGRVTDVLEFSGNCGWGYTCAAPYTTNWVEYANTRYAYSPLDLLSSVVDDLGNTSTLSYDSLGRKVRQVDPDMGTWLYDYDPNGNLVGQVNAEQRVTTFAYDKENRLLHRLVQGNGTTTFSDGFDAQNTTNWAWTARTSVSSGVVTASGTGSDYSTNFYRQPYAIKPDTASLYASKLIARMLLRPLASKRQERRTIVRRWSFRMAASPANTRSMGLTFSPPGRGSAPSRQIPGTASIGRSIAWGGRGCMWPKRMSHKRTAHARSTWAAGATGVFTTGRIPG